MTLLTEAAGRLVSQAVCTGIGTDLFLLEVPRSPDLMTALFTYSGDRPVMTHDGVGDEKPALQVRTRSAVGDLASGETRAKNAYTALHGVANTTVGSTVWKLCIAQGSPMFLGVDDQGRPEWSQNFVIWKDIS